MCTVSGDVGHSGVVEVGLGTPLDEVRERVAVIRPPAYNRFPHSFSHVFAGGSPAGYYGYIWSETLDADSVEPIGCGTRIEWMPSPSGSTAGTKNRDAVPGETVTTGTRPEVGDRLPFVGVTVVSRRQNPLARLFRAEIRALLV